MLLIPLIVLAAMRSAAMPLTTEPMDSVVRGDRKVMKAVRENDASNKCKWLDNNYK